MVKTPAHESGPSFLCEGWGAESVPKKKRGCPVFCLIVLFFLLVSIVVVGNSRVRERSVCVCELDVREEWNEMIKDVNY